MNPFPATTAAAEINRLHEEAGCSVASRIYAPLQSKSVGPQTGFGLSFRQAR